MLRNRVWICENNNALGNSSFVCIFGAEKKAFALARKENKLHTVKDVLEVINLCRILASFRVNNLFYYTFMLDMDIKLVL